MARPIKHTVEYFAHDAHASQGRTLSILYNNFGHEGISAWWLLLETISDTENHVIVIRNLEDVEYLAAKLHSLPDRLQLILKKMADLGAIDQGLYSEGVIWSQNFVDRLKPVYEKRKQELPIKPELSGTITPFLLPITELSIPETPQSKVYKSKVYKRREGGTPAPDKKPYGQFLNVLLTDNEYQKLQTKFNNSANEKIEELSEALKSHKGYPEKFTDHYATILSWDRREEKNANTQRGDSRTAKVDLRAGLGGPGAVIHRPGIEETDITDPFEALKKEGVTHE